MRLVFQLSGEWRLHVQTIVDQSSQMTSCFHLFKYRSRKSLEEIYSTYILPYFDYADTSWDNRTLYLSQKLQNIEFNTKNKLRRCS